MPGLTVRLHVIIHLLITIPTFSLSLFLYSVLFCFPDPMFDGYSLNCVNHWIALRDDTSFCYTSFILTNQQYNVKLCLSWTISFFVCSFNFIHQNIPVTIWTLIIFLVIFVAVFVENYPLRPTVYWTCSFYKYNNNNNDKETNQPYYILKQNYISFTLIIIEIN